jgi:hypothetical protein
MIAARAAETDLKHRPGTLNCMTLPSATKSWDQRRRPLRAVGILAAMTVVGTYAAGSAYAAGPVGFISPTGNIVCEISAGNPAGVTNSVRCDIADFHYPSPPRPPDCGHDIGHTVGLAEGQPPQFGCAHDTMAYSDFPILKSGDSTQSGPFRCDIIERGVACSDGVSGHGFWFSRESYEFR